METKAVTSAKRIGWLLRVNRLHGQRTRYRRLSAFVHDLSVAADRRIVVSTVSRWETGAWSRKCCSRSRPRRRVLHVGGTSSDAFWSAAIARYTDSWVRLHDARTLSTLDRLVYGIGITNR